MRWLVWSVMPLGTLTGGGIATALSLRAALWTGGIGVVFGVLPVALSSVRSIREMPGLEILSELSPTRSAPSPAPAVLDP